MIKKNANYFLLLAILSEIFIQIGYFF